MSRINCKRTGNFFREHKRMCNMYSPHGCAGCALEYDHSVSGSDCLWLCREYPQKAIQIIQKWSNEHPIGSDIDDHGNKQNEILEHNESQKHNNLLDPLCGASISISAALYNSFF